MGTDLNAVSNLLGVDAHDPEALRKGATMSSLHEALNVGSPPVNRFFTHFNTGATIPPGVTLTEEGTTTAAATYGLGLGGWATITTDDVTDKSDSLTSTALLWQVNRQTYGRPLVFEAKWKTGTMVITEAEYWLGITDAVADTNLIALAADSTFTTSTPTDGVYIGYSATPTSGGAFTTGGNQHTCISINNNTDAVVATGGGAFVAQAEYVYRIEVDYDQTARFYVNGRLLATKASALRATVPLGFYVGVIPREASAITADRDMSVDYILMEGN